MLRWAAAEVKGGNLEIEKPGKWAHASASQIDTFRMCNRKWWFNSIAKVKVVRKGSLVLGSAIHAAIESHLLGKRSAPPEHVYKVTRPALADTAWLRQQYTTHPLPSSAVEYEFLDSTTFVAPVKGFIDVKLITVDEVAKVCNIHIIDHKSTKNFRYCKTAKQLKKDPQSIIYCAVTWNEMRDSLGDDFTINIKFSHHYIHSVTAQEPRHVTISFTEEELARGIDEINADLQRILNAKTITNSDDALPTMTACGMYGGCPFSGLCHGYVDPFFKNQGTGEVVNSALWDKLDASEPKQVASEPKQVASEPKQEVETEAGVMNKIYIDCLPVGKDYELLESWCQPEITAWERVGKISYLAHKYNEGVKDVTAAVNMAMLAGKKEVPERLAITSTTPLGNLMLALFRGRTDKYEIVQGVR